MKEKVCPYADFNECPHIKDSKKKKSVLRKTSFILTSDKSEHCVKCGKKIKKGIKYVKWVIKEEVAKHTLKVIGEEINCAKCIGVSDLNG